MAEAEALPGASRSVEAPRQPSNYTLLLLTVSLGGVLAPLNSTMLAVALPELRDDFGVGHAEVAWLVSAYLIAMAVAQPLGGRLGDQLGRARVFRIGLLAFLVLSLACVAVPTFPLLILVRTSQALVGATVIPNGMAMLRESLPTNQLGRSGGITGSAISIAALLGPLVAVVLLALGSWRYLFLMNVPLVGAALLCQYLLAYKDTGERARFDLDWIGGLALAALLVTVTILLNALSGGQASLVLVLSVTVLITSLVLFIRRQTTVPNPVVEWHLFRNRSYAASTAYILLGNLVMYTALLAIPFFVKEVQHSSDGRTAVLLTAIFAPSFIVSPLAGRLSDAIGRRPMVSAGSVLLLAGCIPLTIGINETAPVLFLVSALAILGLGMSLGSGSASAAAIESAPRNVAGIAAGANSMMRYLGSIIGAGVLGAVLNKDAGAPGIGVFHLMFGILTAMAALAAISSFFIHRYPPEEAPRVEPADVLATAAR